MKKSFFAATLLASMFAMSGLAQRAAAQQPPRAGHAIVVIDVAYIFKYHTRLQTMQNDLQRDIQAAEKEVQDARAAMQKLAERLDDYKKGSPEYKSLEEEIARRNSDLTLQVQVQKRNFIEQQARMFSTVYKELCEEVKVYCEASGVGLVMRFNGDPADYNDPEEIFRDMNKTVIYYNPSTDITPLILKKLNERIGSVPTQPAAGAPNGPAALPPRPGIPTRR
ncbi:MAG TPA: OmpH family outer membrane protein [Pirellulales bacterium]|nr:OmpH family outer membrane protein [Pirellulales bacterium]